MKAAGDTVGQPLLLLAMSLVIYRVTRLVIVDELIAGTRIWVRNKLVASQKDRLWRRKMEYLIRCPYCVSWWITIPTVAITDQFTIIQLPWLLGGAAWALSLAWWRFIEQD